MRTISDIIAKLIEEMPLYGEALREGILNVIELARSIKPDIEDVLLETVSLNAVMMAIRRYEKTVREKYPPEVIHPMLNITIRSHLVEVAFHSVPELNTVHQELLIIAKQYDSPFLSYGYGTAETTFDMSRVLFPHLMELTKKYPPIAIYDQLSAISIRLPKDTVTMTGVYAPFVRAMTWQKICVYEIISYFSEITFVIHEKDVDRAFALMKVLEKRSNTHLSFVKKDQKKMSHCHECYACCDAE